jgi:uncharacterized protein YgbK (DUF1537 family)
LIPAAETEYARDAYFGYTHSNLREWITEKHSGEPPRSGVCSISIADERLRGPEHIAERLRGVSGGQYVIVNAASYRDLEVFVAGLIEAEKAGKRFLARTAASYVRVRAGLPPRDLLRHDELLSSPPVGNGGLVVAGSYIQKSTQQIKAACELPNVEAVEVSVERLLDQRQRASEIGRTTGEVSRHLEQQRDVVMYTSRGLVTGATRDESLHIGQIVSLSVIEIVKGLSARPRWLIAKGGITSSDVATKALGIRRALVLGQILPGVPVWRSGAESLWPGLTYVVFPGNVGDENAIVRAMTILRGTQSYES